MTIFVERLNVSLKHVPISSGLLFRDLCKIPLFLISPNNRSPNPGCQLFFVTNSPFFLPGHPIIGHPGCLLGGNGRNYPVGGFQQVQTLRLQMALRTHFAQTKIGCLSIAEFRHKALFDHITGFEKCRLRFVCASFSERLRWALHIMPSSNWGSCSFQTAFCHSIENTDMLSLVNFTS